MLLEKITFDYSMQEDRLCIKAYTPDAESVALWLTQRLCKQLAATLIAHVEKVTVIPALADKELIMAFKQSAALIEQRASAPVALQDNAHTWLVDTIDMHLAPQTVEIAFRRPEQDPARMQLDPFQLRQTLQILLIMFRKADWPTDNWPGWLCDAGQSIASTPPKLSALH